MGTLSENECRAMQDWEGWNEAHKKHMEAFIQKDGCNGRRFHGRRHAGRLMDISVSRQPEVWEAYRTGHHLSHITDGLTISPGRNCANGGASIVKRIRGSKTQPIDILHHRRKWQRSQRHLPLIRGI